MTVDSRSSVPQEIPHSRAGVAELLDSNVLNAGGFNGADHASDYRGWPHKGRYFEIHFGYPESLNQDGKWLIVAREVVKRGAVEYNRWFAGSIENRSRTGDEDFDKKVDEILAGEEIPYTELRSRVVQLMSEDQREIIDMLEGAYF